MQLITYNKCNELLNLSFININIYIDTVYLTKVNTPLTLL